MKAVQGVKVLQRVKALQGVKARQHVQRGIAVITVLLALAIAVIICSEVIMRVYTGMKRSANYFNHQQAWEYALGAEAMARQLLAADFEKDKSSVRVDHFLEKWAVPQQKMAIDGGSVEFEIYDMQARFNLNNLISEDGGIVPEQVKILKGLFSYLGVRPVMADLAARWASYADDTDNIYGTDKYPYRAGDTQFGSVSEMRQLKDIEMKEYQRLQPFVSALPVPVTININTAPAQVLASFTDNSEQAIERIKSFVERRKQLLNGYSSPGEFIQMMGLGGGSGSGAGDGDGEPGDGEPADDESGGGKPGEGDGGDGDGGDSVADLLGVSSEYFEVRAIVDYNGNKVWLVSTLFRDAQTGEISLLSRDTSQRFTLGNSRSLNDSNAANDSEQAANGSEKAARDSDSDN